ncbi:putative lipid scramblase CLPTM1 [Sycon ciliatum]|uniref:putative lipid scramblase CLPTM1 n=1 Tax=Sycon ciliatum TaxID=27933 RepID=UPI0031F63F45
MADNAQVAAAGPGDAAPAGGEQQQQQQQPSILRTILTQLFIMYAINSFFRSGKTSGPAASVGRNLFPPNQSMELAVYLTESSNFTEFNCTSCLLWEEAELVMGSWTDGPNKDGKFSFSTNISISEAVQNNGSLYLHAFVTKTGHSPDPSSTTYNQLSTVNSSRLLTRYKPQPIKKTANLLTGESDQNVPEIKDDTPRKIISFWHPNLTLNVLADHTNWQRDAVPPPMDKFIEFDNMTGDYFPVLYMNDYWNMAKDHYPINETTPVLPLNLEYSPLTIFYWQMYLSQSMKPQWMQWMGEQQATDEEQDSFKETLVETNPYLLGMTIVVSLLHTVFEFLAFKNDIQFWRNRKSLEGLSVRTIFMSVVQSVIVLLYVIDNDTNTMVIISVAVGLVIEMWKLPKVLNIGISPDRKLLGVLPLPTFAYKSTYIESPTKKYDEMAFKYLSWLAFPLLVGYGVYSLLYQEHKGWYSFVLGMCYGFLLTFGFIMMTPQLFINYKLKSVAHLPWRMMTYKALNTFIDDIFAFVIKMPMLYRIGCLRDDVIFFIFLYQRYIYRVDHTRVNEFGVSGEDLGAPGEGVSATAAVADAAEVADGQEAESAPEALPEDDEADRTEEDGGESSSEPAATAEDDSVDDGTELRRRQATST